MEIPKTYDPREAEQRHYSRREEQGCFAPETKSAPLAPVYSTAVPLEGLMDFAQERERLGRERDRLNDMAQRTVAPQQVTEALK